MAFYVTGNVVDQNNIPVVGAQVYVFSGGVLATLQDVAGNALANPLLTVADGFFEGYSVTTGPVVAQYYWGGKLRYIQAFDNLSEIEAYAATALAAAGPNYASTAAGLAATDVGDTFAVDNADGTLTIYSHDIGGVATELRSSIKDPSASTAAALIGTTNGNVQDDLDSIVGLVSEPDPSDLPASLYVGSDVEPENLVSGGLGNNILVGRNILSPDFTGTDAINPDTGYGLTYIGTGIGSQNQTNCRDNEIIGYEAGYYLGNANQMQIIGAKALYCDLTRAVAPNTGAPQAGVVIGITAHFDGLTATSQKFVSIGANVGRENTRAFETVYIGQRAAYHLADGLYNIAIGNQALGGATDASATNTINNVAIGWNCLGGIGNGTQNVAMGPNAGRGVTTGGRNILIGHGAASNLATPNATSAGANALTTGSNNTVIGDNAQVSGAAASYQVAIGSGAAATANNQMMFGDTGRDHQYAFTNGYTKGKIYTVATLPNAATAGAGSRAFVSDTNLTVSSSFWTSTTGTGGGANFAPVVSDGSAWRIG